MDSGSKPETSGSSRFTFRTVLTQLLIIVEVLFLVDSPSSMYVPRSRVVETPEGELTNGVLTTHGLIT